MDTEKPFFQALHSQSSTGWNPSSVHLAERPCPGHSSLPQNGGRVPASCCYGNYFSSSLPLALGRADLQPPSRPSPPPPQGRSLPLSVSHLLVSEISLRFLLRLSGSVSVTDPSPCPLLLWCGSHLPLPGSLSPSPLLLALTLPLSLGPFPCLSLSLRVTPLAARPQASLRPSGLVKGEEKGCLVRGQKA